MTEVSQMMTVKARTYFVNRMNAARLVCLVVLMTVASVAAFAFADRGVVAQSSGITLAQASSAVTNLDVVLVIDQSGSMWARNDVQATNPNGSVKTPSSRMIAANILAEWLANDQSGAQHQLSVVMFGTTAKVVFPLQ